MVNCFAPLFATSVPNTKLTGRLTSWQISKGPGNGSTVQLSACILHQQVAIFRIIYNFDISSIPGKPFVMKKIYTLLAFAALMAASFSFNACDKLKNDLFKAFTANGGSIDFTVPIISNTSTKTDMGTAVNNYNIDSIIKAETGGVFGLKDIKKITITEAKVKINNADADNNWANCEEGWVMFSTNQMTTPTAIATGLIPDTYSDEITLPSVAGINLKDYLTGNVLTYIVQGKMRRATTKSLNCTLSVKFYIE